MRVDNFVKNLNSTAKKVIPVVKIAHSVAVVSNDVTKLDNQLISNAAGPASSEDFQLYNKKKEWVATEKLYFHFVKNGHYLYK